MALTFYPYRVEQPSFAAEKFAPHYDLVTVQKTVASLGAEAFTVTALNGGRRMGLTIADMLRTIAALSRGDFYKSTTTYADHRIWQDVYHGRIRTGKLAYIKITMRDSAPVVQFKEMER